MGRIFMLTEAGNCFDKKHLLERANALDLTSKDVFSLKSDECTQNDLLQAGGSP